LALGYSSRSALADRHRRQLTSTVEKHVYFFTVIGLNAHIGDLVRGGRPLGALLAITVAFMFMQNLANTGGGVLGGSPTNFGTMLAAEVDKWGKVVKFAGIKPEGSGNAG
jgi:sodium--glutamate symport carrier gltS